MTQEALADRRYWLLAAALSALMLCHLWRDAWLGDFWQFVGVVDELAARPLTPRHPFVDADAPSRYFSPYTWLVGLVCRATGLAAVDGLRVAALVNLVLLLTGFRLFVGELTRRRETAFFALLFMLLLWGDGFFYSGFFKLGTLGFVLPYPSAFAITIGWFALAWQIRSLRDPTGRAWRLAAMLPLLSVAFLTHPPSAAAVFVALTVLAATSDEPVAALARTFAVIAVAVALAFAWPFYSLWQLLFGFSGEYQYYNGDMYGLPVFDLQTAHRIDVGQLLLRLAPPGVGLPLLALRLRRNVRDPLAWMFGGLLGVYLFGGVTGQYSLGRVLPALVLTLQIAAADWVAELALRRRAARSGAPGGFARPELAYLALIALVLGFGALRAAQPIRDTLVQASVPFAPLHRQYEFLREWVGHDDVAITNTQAMVLAGVVGKVVSARGAIFPFTFLDDQNERNADQRRFFRRKTTQAARRAILEKYDVEFIVFDHRSGGEAIAARLRKLGAPTARVGYYELIDVRQGAASTNEAPGASDSPPAPAPAGGLESPPHARSADPPQPQTAR